MSATLTLQTPSATDRPQDAAPSPVLPISTVAGGLYLDADQARAIGEGLAGDYCFAEPFPHIVLDNFLPEAITRMALEHFPREATPGEMRFEMGYAGFHKRQISPEVCDEQVRQLFHFFNSQPMLAFLEGLTAIDGLIPDPYFSGGGFHETGSGGKLGVHADFRINEKMHLNRRMNVIIYLNPDWQPQWGGELELWERDMSRKSKSVQPVFNRCVVFNTDDTSYHGHPDPMPCPEGVFRRSIALYYYTASKAIYSEVPKLSTMYQARPQDSAEIKREARKLRRDQYLAQWTPPALHRYVFGVMRRLGI